MDAFLIIALAQAMTTRFIPCFNPKFVSYLNGTLFVRMRHDVHHRPGIAGHLTDLQKGVQRLLQHARSG